MVTYDVMVLSLVTDAVTIFEVGSDAYYFSRIRFANWFRQESEMFNLFLSNKVPNSKSDFQTRFETCSRYSHTPPETSVIVNRERINNLFRRI